MKSPLLFIIGCIVLIGGCGLGLYIGVWIMLVGGIIDIVDVVKSSFTNPMLILSGILKIMFASLCGWLTAIFATIVSAFFFSAAAK